MKRVLLATPVRDSLTLPYAAGLVETFSATQFYHPDHVFIPAISKATYVNCARNDLVEHAREKKADEIVFIDADVAWGLNDLLRLLSHDVDIVAGLYSKRKPGEPEWTAHAEEGSEPDERGLQRCNDVATGFLRVRMSVFDALFEKFPERHFQHDGEKVRCEYFPLALTQKGGWRHPAEARLWAIRDVLDSDLPGDAIRAEIMAIIDEKHGLTRPLPELVGEDCGFCRLAKAAGFTVWGDVGLRLRHHGDVGFPAQQLPL